MRQVQHKDAAQLAYDANLKRLRTEGRIVLDSILNEAVEEMRVSFNEALAGGNILHVKNTDEVQTLLRTGAQRTLGSGS